jgi:TonB family protein
MRKTAFVQSVPWRFSFICIFALSLFGLPAFAQDAQPADSSVKEAPAVMPSDPKELMLLAAKTNGLTGDDMRPWHLKATWKMLDEKGSVADQGTYEEFWVSNTKYKLTFTTKTGSRTEYGTEKGIVNSDSEAPVDTHDLRRLWIFPMPIPGSLKSSDFGLRPETANGENLNCLYRKGANGDPSGPLYCLDPQTSILRYTEYPFGSERAIRRKIISFQGHYFAEDLQAYFGLGNKGSLTVHLENIGTIDPIDEALFNPPSSAVPQKIKSITLKAGSVIVSPSVMAGLIVKKVQPDYPLIAEASRVMGTVVLQATISKTGRVENLRVISGPPMLQQAALDAVKQWVYKPYMVNGEPVVVMTIIDVNFRLGN